MFFNEQEMLRRMNKSLVLIPVVIIILVFFAGIALVARSRGGIATTLWQYQCIDTMKLSRDSARALMHDARTDLIITNQVTAIKNLGANCIAIDTPYDEEFIPYLKRWVDKAREKKLHVWFRGNFSGWEQWFNYKQITPQEHLQKTKRFILSHADLFQDGDIFTPVPEVENGWPGNFKLESVPDIRQFLKDEYVVSSEAFQSIHKHVETNWFSMSGGAAQATINQSTADTLGRLVTIDHYVKSPDVMDKFITYFHNTYHANVVIGEFGAPIPDLNGNMSEQEQAAFVDSIFFELYKYKNIVRGVNYWTLTDSSTALLHNYHSERQVADVIRKYFMPTIVSGTVTNTLGEPLQNARIKTLDGVWDITTDAYGQFTLAIPSASNEITIAKDTYNSSRQKIIVSKTKQLTTYVELAPVHPTLWYKVRLFFVKLVK